MKRARNQLTNLVVPMPNGVAAYSFCFAHAGGEEPCKIPDVIVMGRAGQYIAIANDLESIQRAMETYLIY